MPYKICSTCRKISYSAANHRIWYCPSCGEDISCIANYKYEEELIGLKKKNISMFDDLMKRKTV